MQQPGYAPQPYPPPPPGYPPQQYVQQQPVMIQQGGYPMQYQSGMKAKIALILTIILTVISSGTGIFFAVAIHRMLGVGLLVFFMLTNIIGLAGAGCKNACLMMTYAALAINLAIGTPLFGGISALAASGIASSISPNGSSFDRAYVDSHETGLKVFLENCIPKDSKSVLKWVEGQVDVPKCVRNQKTYWIVNAILLFLLTPLYGTCAALFMSTRKEIKALKYQAAPVDQPPVITYSGSQTQQTA